MTSTVQINVKLFGSQAQTASQNEILLGFDREPTCAQVLEAIGEQCPLIKPTLGVSRLALNHAFASAGDLVSSSDEVALVGFVGGG